MDVARQRVFNQHIAGERLCRPTEVVRWMGAMQAQDYYQALWAIGLRTASATAADITAAIAERGIVLTWLLRGTLHVVAAENVKWLLELLAPRRLAADASRLRQLELDNGIMERCARLFQHALQGGRQLTRSDLMHLLEGAGISPAGQRGYHILWYLAQMGLLCLGPMPEKEQTFVLLDEWIPESRRLSRDEALAELAGCYFASHGPATLADFATWAGLTLTDARAGLKSARSSLRSERRGASEYWSSAHPPGHAPQETDDVFLLPGFDEYLLGYKDRSDVLAPEHAPSVAPGANGIFFPIVVIGGQVVGTWKRIIKRGAVHISVRSFIPLAISEARLVEAAARFSAFLGVPLAAVEISHER